MLTVHHLNNSRSQRILWLMEELGLEYEIKRYERDKTTMRAPASLRTVHPLGKSPVITEGDVTVAESGAIIEYLIERHGKGRLVPAVGTADRLRYTYWLHFAEGTAMPPLVMKLVFNRIETGPMPFFIRPIAKKISATVKNTFINPELAQQLNYVETEIAKTGWFAGPEFSAADVQMSFPLEAAASRGGLNASHPRLMEFLKRIHARPAYQRALKRGGAYELLS